MGPGKLLLEAVGCGIRSGDGLGVSNISSVYTDVERKSENQ